MNDFTRRNALTIGAAAIGAAGIGATALPGQAYAVEDVAEAKIAPLDLKIEKNATLRVLRPAKFVDADEAFWRANTKKYTDATGIPVRVDFVSWEDLRPQTAVVANTGAGPDIVIGFSADPQIYAPKLVDLSDLAGYLGGKYGGWFRLAEIYGQKWGTNQWLSIPIGGGTGPLVYRKSWLQDAGYDRAPDDMEGFLVLCQKLKKIGHPVGFSLGHALGDANGYASWLLWTHGASLVDEKGKISLDSKETNAALKYAIEMQKTMIEGTLSWNDSGNNQAFLAGQIGLTSNGISIYYAAKNSSDPKMQAIAADIGHQTMPFGVSVAPPQSAAVMSAMVFNHSRFPNAAKDYIRFMMEADQYAPWLSNCLGYWAQPLKAYAKMKFWNSDSILAPFRIGMDTAYYDGYKGPVTPASSAVSANYTVVDMFASVVSGNATPEAAAKQAAKAAQRYYKGST